MNNNIEGKVVVITGASSGLGEATQGMENATAISKIHGNTFDDTWKQNGKIIDKVHGRVLGRRTLTTTVDGQTGRTALSITA